MDTFGSFSPSAVLVVLVTDPSDANWQPRGKQVREPKGIWYTPTTGIWQTVWLEEVPETYIIDRGGVIRRKFIGPVDWNQTEVVEYLSRL